MLQFFNDPDFVYQRYEYDLGFEDTFGVMWLDEQTDAEFLRYLWDKYPDVLRVIDEKLNKRPQPRTYFTLNTFTRFADNDIATLFRCNAGPQHISLLREALTYCVKREVGKGGVSLVVRYLSFHVQSSMLSSPCTSIVPSSLHVFLNPHHPSG